MHIFNVKMMIIDEKQHKKQLLNNIVLQVHIILTMHDYI